MTSYPINYEYDKNAGSTYDGTAETAEAARDVFSTMLTEANGEPTEAPEPWLTTTEAGMKSTRDKIEQAWAAEIAAGWVTPLQVYNGWIAEVTYWTIS